MTTRTSAQLKAYFETGDKPTQAQFGDLIDTIFANSGTVINVKAYGAIGNGVADDTSSINSAISALATAGGGVLYFPQGTYLTTGNHSVSTNNFCIRGDSPALSIIKFNQDAASVSCFIRSGSTIDKENLLIENIRFYGTADISPTVPGERRFTAINGYRRVMMRNVEGFYSRQMSFSGAWCDQVIIQNCKVEKSLRDGFNFTNCNRQQFIGNCIDGCGDDAIAAHVNNSVGTPVSAEFIAIGNRISDSYGIKFLGAKKVIISENNMSRMKGYGVFITFDTTFSEGFSPVFGNIVSNNNIHDVIDAAAFGAGTIRSGIILGSYPPTTGGGAIANIPTLNNTATGAVINYIGYMYNIGNGASVIQAGGFNCIVSNNIIARTLPAVASYSTWGYGKAWTNTGESDVAITDANMSIVGITLSRSMRNCNIRGNVIAHERQALVLQMDSTSPDYKFSNILFDGNLVYNCCQSGTVTDGVVLNDTSTDRFVGVTVRNNFFDIDPLVRSSARNGTNGTWNTGSSSVPAGVNAAFTKGVSLGGNHYRNCVRFINTSAGSIFYVDSPETLHCQPAVTGTSNTNKGIGNCPEANPGRIQYFIEDCDPTSATFTAALEQNIRNSSSIPTSGTYVRGHIVWNTTPTIDANSMVLLGWLRLTTGTGHVSGTDWAIMRTSTVSPAV